MKFSDRIIQFRAYLSWKESRLMSRARLGQLLGVTEKTIESYETGKSTPTRARMAQIEAHMKDEKGYAENSSSWTR